MNILVLNGSPRPNGNTKGMIEAFREGAVSAGHPRFVTDLLHIPLAGCAMIGPSDGNGGTVHASSFQAALLLLV